MTKIAIIGWLTIGVAIAVSTDAWAESDNVTNQAGREVEKFSVAVERFLESLGVGSLSVSELNNTASNIQTRLREIVLSDKIEAPEDMALEVVNLWCNSYNEIVQSEKLTDYFANNSAVHAWLRRIDCRKVSTLILVEPIKLKRFLLQELIKVSEK